VVDRTIGAGAPRSAGRTFVTTSWDDGHCLDLALADLLDRYELPGTFYIAPRNREIPNRQRLTPQQVSQLATRFEIGGHTLTHARLPDVSEAVALDEMVSGRAILEDWAGCVVTSFCYPGGAYDNRHPSIVAHAGFSMARTVRRHTSEFPDQRFEIGTTFHAYRHWSDPISALRFASPRPRCALRYYMHWDDWAMAWFDHVLVTGGVYHLWGHSWELQKNDDWSRLERVFAHISHSSGVTYVDNAALATIPHRTGDHP
jgi:peptidoglycan/xylan/chitin deacetylase (PgdA/CDA1 family)